VAFATFYLFFSSSHLFSLRRSKNSRKREPLFPQLLMRLRRTRPVQMRHKRKTKTQPSKALPGGRLAHFGADACWLSPAYLASRTRTTSAEWAAAYGRRPMAA